jgi:beta-lactamase superfamily II metal-dependent hydrolase
MGNPFGLPKIDVLERLEDSKVTTYRTDMDGAVTFFLDGTSVAEGKPLIETNVP